MSQSGFTHNSELITQNARAARPHFTSRGYQGRSPCLVKDETIRRLLRMKISWAGTVVVLVGKETHSRPWVNWEIEQANKQRAGRSIPDNPSLAVLQQSLQCACLDNLRSYQ